MDCLQDLQVESLHGIETKTRLNHLVAKTADKKKQEIIHPKKPSFYFDIGVWSRFDVYAVVVLLLQRHDNIYSPWYRT